VTKQDWAVSLTHCGHGQHVRDRTACVFIVLPLHVCESCIPNLGQGWEQGLVSFETLTNGLVMKESTRENIYIYIRHVFLKYTWWGYTFNLGENHATLQLWKTMMWMQLMGGPCPKRTILVSNSCRVNRLQTGRLVRAMQRTTVATTVRYRNANGKLRYKGSKKLKSTQPLI